MWSRSLKLLLVEAAIFGLSNQAFEILFSLYLDNIGISFATMGVIFSISGLISFFVIIVLGAESDVRGRKLFYSASLVVGSITSFVVPTLRNTWALTGTRVTKDILIRIRWSLHPTFVFEHMRRGYAKLIAIVQGIEYTSMGIGSLLAGSMLFYLGFQKAFITVGVLFIAAFLIFQKVEEPKRPKVERKSLREMYRLDIPKELKILSASNFIYGIGFSICHTFFIFALFFIRKFAVNTLTLSLVLGVHNFTFGIPMIIASRLFARPGLDLKKVFIVGNLVMGLSHVFTAFIPILLPATAIWYIHDILGAAVSMPAGRALVQNYSRDESRGKDVNITTAFTSIGMFIGPVFGGYLAQIDINLPFIVGGLIIAVASLMVLPLRRTVVGISKPETEKA